MRLGVSIILFDEAVKKKMTKIRFRSYFHLYPQVDWIIIFNWKYLRQFHGYFENRMVKFYIFLIFDSWEDIKIHIGGDAGTIDHWINQSFDRSMDGWMNKSINESNDLCTVEIYIFRYLHRQMYEQIFVCFPYAIKTA